MRLFNIVLSVGLIALSGLGIAQAQSTPIQGTPASVFPYARPNEVQMFNDVPCRTMYDPALKARVPVACAGDVSVRKVN
jgi:hypothetical protein